MRGIATALATGLALYTPQANAQSTTGLSIELNAVSQDDAGCTLSFLLENAYESEIQQAVYEAVLFDTDGQVSLLTLFDFGTLPAGRPRVRQFTLPQTECSTIGRLLVNGSATCQAQGIGPSACTDGLVLGTRTEIEVVG